MQYYRRYIDSSSTPVQKEEDDPQTHGSYGALLFDRRWKDKRSQILLRDQNRCVICGLDEDLQVHHRQYQFVRAVKKFKAPWEYPDQSLITLCNSCHQRGHSQFKVPIIYI